MQRLYVVYVRITNSNKLSAGIFAAVKSGENEFSQAAMSSGELQENNKIIFFETRKTKRQAMLRVKELNALNKRKLYLMIKSQNPEMLDLKDLFSRSKRLSDESAGIYL